MRPLNAKTEPTLLKNLPTSLPNLSPPQPTTLKIAPQIASESKETRRCFRCQGHGHIASECLNKRVITLPNTKHPLRLNGGKKEVYLNEALEEVEKDLVVVRVALSCLATQEGNEQWAAIFHTRCTIGGKVRSLIIDGDSYMNAASKTLVEELKLTTLHHPLTYTIQWPNQGKGIQVSCHCLVSSSIGKSYKD